MRTYLRPTAPTLLLTLILGSITARLHGDDWPQWRGPRRNGASEERGLLQQWPEGGPSVLWKSEDAGVAYSSVSVANGRVFTQGDLDGVEQILCYRESDGSLVWAVQPEPVAKSLGEKVNQGFARIDTNNDGKLDEIESIVGLGRGYATADDVSPGNASEIARHRAATLLERLDQNADGELSFSEIPAQLNSDYFQRVDSATPGVEVAELARTRRDEALALDKDSDGRVSRKEAAGTLIHRFFSSIDERPRGQRRGDQLLTADELQDFFSRRMRGRDGIISLNELSDYFERTFPNRDGVLTKADLRRFLGGYRNSYGDGPRGTPTIDGDRVYVEGGMGDLSCLDAKSGKTIWHLNLQSDLSGRRPGWGYSESPLVAGDLLIVTPGGNQGTIAALNKADGKIVWRSSGITEGAHYSSPMLARISGRQQVVQFARNSLFGVSLDDGVCLWKYSGANNGTANVATPIIAGDYVLASSGYGTGAGLVKITGSSQLQSSEIYFEKLLANHHGGLVKVEDHVYGFGNAGLICMNFMTGKITWRARSVSKGSLVYADGHLYCHGERNVVALVEANPNQYIEKGRFLTEATDRPSWPHPVVANGRLYLRDQNNLTCYDIQER